jgi:hypothetical protein
MSLEIIRAQGYEAQRDQIVDVVRSRMKYSEQYYIGVRLRLPRLYDLWRGIYTGKFHPHKNNVHIPLIYSAIWADAARKAATSLNAYPVLNFFGYGPDDKPISQKWEALINAQMKDAEIFQKEVTTFVMGDLYGTAISQIMWDHKEEYKIITDAATLPLSGKRVQTIKQKNVVTFDGPNWENVDRLDFFPQPGYRNQKKMQWVIRRYFLDMDDLRYLAKQGIYDQNEMNRMVFEGGVMAENALDEALIRRFQVRSGMTEEQARFMDKYSRPIELLEFWGTIPSELAPDGAMNRVITIANRRYLMRNRPNPFWHGQKPFVVYSPTPDPHYFDAPGKAEIAEKLQIVANKYINQTLDAADLVIDPMWFYDRNKGLNTRNLYSRPGRFIPVDGDPAAAVMPLQTNLQGMNVGGSKVEEMRRYIQMGTGIVDDAIQGIGEGSDRQTAREFVGRREAAGTRLMLESRLYEETYLEPLGNMMVSLNKQFLEPPREVMVLGDSATVDPDTGAPIDTTHALMDAYDMVPDYMARAMGATSALSRGVRQQNLAQLLQYISTNPQMAGAVNMINFMRQMFREFELPNINELIQKQPALQDALAQATGGQPNAAAVPTSGQIAGGQIPSPAQGALGRAGLQQLSITRGMGPLTSQPA